VTSNVVVRRDYSVMENVCRNRAVAGCATGSLKRIGDVMHPGLQVVPDSQVDQQAQIGVLVLRFKKSGPLACR
jgi:hypothetical protein